MQHTATLTPVRTAAAAHRRSRPRGRGQVSVSRWIHRNQSALATGAIVTLIIAAVVVAVLSLTVKPEAPLPSGWTHVTVEPNASLWSLASAHPVSGLGTSETATLIAEENGLESGVIHPGQTLSVPSTGLTDMAVALR